MGEHTPTPWYFEELGPHRTADGCGYIRCENDNLEISHHGDMGRSRAENLANAAFIVEAVNSYDRNRATIAALVGKLTVARNMLEGYAKHDERIGHIEDAAFTSRVVAEIDAALQLARGSKGDE